MEMQYLAFFPLAFFRAIGLQLPEFPDIVGTRVGNAVTLSKVCEMIANVSSLPPAHITDCHMEKCSVSSHCLLYLC